MNKTPETLNAEIDALHPGDLMSLHGELDGLRNHIRHHGTPGAKGWCDIRLSGRDAEVILQAINHLMVDIATSAKAGQGPGDGGRETACPPPITPREMDLQGQLAASEKCNEHLAKIAADRWDRLLQKSREIAGLKAELGVGGTDKFVARASMLARRIEGQTGLPVDVHLLDYGRMIGIKPMAFDHPWRYSAQTMDAVIIKDATSRIMDCKEADGSFNKTWIMKTRNHGDDGTIEQPQEQP